MDPLTNLLALMALSGSLSLFVLDTSGRTSFAEGEVFPSPAGSFYDRGWTTGYYSSSHSEFGDGNMITMNIAKGFSLQRFYLTDAQLIDFGGYAGVYNQFLQEPEELLLLNTDYLAGAQLSYLNGGLLTRLSWDYERHQAQPDPSSESHHSQEPKFIPSAELDDDSSDHEDSQESNDNPQLIADRLELLIGDIRKTFRYYLAYGNFQHFAPSHRKGSFRFGFDYRGNPDGRVHMILAAEQRSYAYNNWAVTNSVRLGMEKSQDPFNGWRILWEWTEGKSDYGPYPQANARISGISFQRIF